MSLPGPVTPDVFGRLDHRELNLPTAVLWARHDMLGGEGLIRRLGFRELGAESYNGVLPDITTLVADMSSETEVRLALTPPPGSEAPPRTLAEAHFAEPHEASRSDAAHRDGRLIVLTSAEPMLSVPTIGEFVLSCWGAVLPLAIFAWETGVGTRP